jgi:hypothetical protein
MMLATITEPRGGSVKCRREQPWKSVRRLVPARGQTA